MPTYLQSLVQRLKQHSKSLSDTAGFMEIPWAFIDEGGVKVTYIFRRQGDILVSRQGEVTRGTWEYLPQIQSLLIQAQGKERIYNQALLLESAIMVLRKDGTDELFALANPEKIPDLDITSYLESFEQNTLRSGENLAPNPTYLPNDRVYETTDGKKIRLVSSNKKSPFFSENALGSDAIDFYSKLTIGDGRYKLKDNGFILEVKNGKVMYVHEDAKDFMFIILIIILIVVVTVGLASLLGCTAST
jgi:hypothetical protein